MTFMVIENFRSGKAPDVYRRFRDRGRMAPEGVRYVSSWVDLGFERCFQVMEAESEALLRQWTANWEDLIDFELVPVRNVGRSGPGNSARALRAGAPSSHLGM
jgi:hypothetical protein